VNAFGPGPAEPYPAADATAIADLFGVDAAAVAGWLDDGLPHAGDLIDPMVCTNWLSWGRLDRAPILARRWHVYLAGFRAHRQGQAARHRVTWNRSHTLYLPEAVISADWWLPDPIACDWQQLEQCGDLSDLRARSAGGQWLCRSEPSTTWEVHGSATVVVASQHGNCDAAVVSAMRDVVAEFRYGYRRHERHERHERDEPRQVRKEGTCLDCALALGSHLSSLGRAWQLCAGLTARSAVANAHYWLLVEQAGGGWVPVDPSIPAIARMLGDDWQQWIDAYAGSLDAWRVTLACAELTPAGAEQFVSVVPGQASAAMAGGEMCDAWACIDWVCGETVASFSIDPVDANS
jgi:hypothetical protein